jgi:hypothetical protein
MQSTVETKNHDEIRRWAEERGGIPTVVEGTGGLLRIDFVRGRKSGGRDPRLHEVPWDEWFRVFDENDLVFLYSPRKESRFFKLVYPETVKEKKSRGRRRGPAAGAAAKRRSPARRSQGRRTTKRAATGSLRRTSKRVAGSGSRSK